MKTTGSLFFGTRVHRVEIVRHVPLPQLVTLSGALSIGLNGGTTQCASTTIPKSAQGQDHQTHDP